MISCEAVRKADIRTHYELATPFYRMLWGAHIHHGMWDGAGCASPRAAQRRLVERLAQHAAVARGSEVLDVGCGMGGSAIHLAERLGCRVTGLTLSGVQRAWATLAARARRVGRRTRFLRQDAEDARFAPASFDVVWSIECTEHLFDKAGFFRRAASWVRPGGRVAVCAWLAGDSPRSPAAQALVHAVCEGFLCPSLGTAEDYVGWIESAGLRPEYVGDWTAQVERTWEICDRRARFSGVKWLARLAGRSMQRFVDRFDTILRAYRTGAMKYACIVAGR